MVKLGRVLGVGLGLAVVACGGGGGGTTSSGDGTTGGGETSSQYAGPIGSTDTARGQDRYQVLCNGCHSGGPDLANLGWSVDRVRRQIREGSANMQAIRPARLDDADMEAVLAYLQTIGTISADGATPAAQ